MELPLELTDERGGAAKEQYRLLTTVLTDAISLGLRKMAELCSETSYAELVWSRVWHICSEAYSASLTELINAWRLGFFRFVGRPSKWCV